MVAGFKPGDLGHLAEHDRIKGELAGRLSDTQLNATIAGAVSTQHASDILAFAPQATPAALNPWLSAVADREHAPAHAVFWGTSMTEGGPMISTSRLDRWVDRLDFGLRSKFPPRTPVAGSVGYIPSFYGTFPAGGASQFGLILPPGVTVNRALAQAGYGFGMHALELSQAGDFWQIVFSGSTGLDLFFNTRDVAGSGATITVDGGAPSALAVPAAISTQGPTYQMRGLSAGSHTVRVDWTAGHVDIQGVYPYNGDEASGIHVWDAGKGSSKAGDFNIGVFNQHAYIQPALIGIEYGYNEYFGGIPAATFATNLATLVTRALSNVTKPPTVLFLVWPRGGNPATTYPIPYQQYVDAIYALAAATPNGIVLDFSKRLPSPVVDNALGFFGGDFTHPSNRGGAYFADTILAAISPR